MLQCPKMSWLRMSKRNLAYGVLVAGFLGGGLVLLWAASLEIPDLATVSSRRIEQSTKFFDRTGTVLLYDMHEHVQRTVVPLEEMSPAVRNATVAIEDSSFYEHGGIRFTSILRAIVANFFIRIGIADGYTQGGSTITQQVIKRALLTPERTLARKLKEWILAVKLEQSWPKEKILELYLNEAPYGGSIYGVEEASQTYFGKRAAELSVAEASYLAAMLQAPTYYSPFGNHIEALEERRRLVLSKMNEYGFITEAERRASLAESVTFIPPRETKIAAPHFVFYVRELLEERYGDRMLREGGLRVITTLDAELQKKAEEIVKRRALENEEKFNAENAAIVAVDPRNGEILTMAGSRDYFDRDIDGNFNIALAKRQPGSAFKPFVYASALSKGYTPDTVVFDVETQFSSTCRADDFETEGTCYSPENYDNIFRGPVTLRDALAQSINIPAVKVLYLTGLSDALRLAKALGIGTLGTPDQYGLTLVLGGGEVRLLDMVSAYGVFAAQGVRVEPSAILRVEDQQGSVVDTFAPRASRVLSEEVAMQINDILSDNKARTPAFGENSSLYFPGRDVAAKTGTTNDYRDAWIVGYTPTLAAGAWAGNNDNTPMQKKVAGFIVAPLWHEFMEYALQKIPSPSFPRTEISYEGLKPVLRGIWQGVESYTLDVRTGLLATELTPPEYRTEFVRGGVHSILYSVKRSDPLGPPPENPADDPQFRLWEPPVLAWAARNGYGSASEIPLPGTSGGAVAPSPATTASSPSGTSTFSLSSPAFGTTLPRNKPAALGISAPPGVRIARVQYFVGGSFIGSTDKPPYALSFLPSSLPLLSGVVTIQALIVEESGSGTTVETSVLFGN